MSLNYSIRDFIIKVVHINGVYLVSSATNGKSGTTQLRLKAWPTTPLYL